MPFPATRLRRLRSSEALRTLVRETRLTPASLVYPLFVCPGEGVRKPVTSMPGVANLSIDELIKEAAEAHALGIPAVILFGLPDKKDEAASGAWAEDGIVQRAARALERELPDLLLIGDVCLCEYMSHGHCGVVRQTSGAAHSESSNSGNSKARVVGGGGTKAAVAVATAKAEAQYEIENDATLQLLAKTAVSQARAGVDI